MLLYLALQCDLYLRNLISHWNDEIGIDFLNKRKRFEDFPQIGNWNDLKKLILKHQGDKVNFFQNHENFQQQNALRKEEGAKYFGEISFLLDNPLEDRRTKNIVKETLKGL